MIKMKGSQLNKYLFAGSLKLLMIFTGILIWLILLSCCSDVKATNLIFNGGFESGNTGFQTDYTYYPPPNYSLNYEGAYAVGIHPSPLYRSDDAFD